MLINHFLLLSIIYFGLCSQNHLYACASCGSGGDEAMVLHPNEQYKAYLGLSQASGFKNINSRGEKVNAGGPDRKQTLLTSFGMAINTKSFVTLSVSSQQNRNSKSQKTSLGDPAIHTRYTLIQQSFVREWVPQWQMILGYKHSQATSIHDSKDPLLLDVFGNGFSEVKLGSDLWWGISKFKPGIAQYFSYPLAKNYHGKKLQPGMISRTTVSAGYGWLPNFRTTLGINRETRGSLEINHDKQARSEQLNHSLFATADYQITPKNSLRLSLAEQAAFAQNKNTARFLTTGVSYQHVF